MTDEFDEEDGAGETSERGKAALPPGRKGGAIRPRVDGFTPDKQRKFFKVLRKTGCITDACRAAAISTTTVDRWRNRDEAFDGQVVAARGLASVSLDAVAWKRATEGTKEEVWRDGRLVCTRVKQSDSMLRLLMQGADPERYGRTGPMPRKDRHQEKKLRKQIEQEIRAEESEAAHAGLAATLTRLVDMVKRRETQAKLAAGWSAGPDGRLVVPPGWRMVRAVPLLPPPKREAN